VPVTIRSLLHRWDASTRLIVPAQDETEPSIDVPVTWVHSSELPDPTPFLDAGHLLLTDGSQFPRRSRDRDPYGSYVARLSERGVVGLGFGTPLIHRQLPDALESACRRQGLPLFLVTDLTPFLAIARYVADELANEQQARIRWSLQAQRAVARAAQRPDGLISILAELENQLDCSAMLFDAAGARIRSPGDPPDLDTPIHDAVRAALEQGVRSSSRIVIDGQEFTVQTIGHSNRLDGALVLGGLDWADPAAADLAHSVIGLASLALTQKRSLEKAHHHLRAGLFEQLLKGDRVLATRTATSVWGGLPSAPLTVLVARRPHHSDFILDALEREAEERGGRVFFTERENRILVLTETPSPAEFLQLFSRHSIPVGTADAIPFEALSRGVAEAERALLHAIQTGQPNVAFREFLDRGMLGLLRAQQVGTVARGILCVLHDHDVDRGAELLTTVRVWVQNECAWDATARELGIHRHTLRNRVQLAGRLLGLDLDLLRDRLELWTAVQLMTED